MTGPVRTSQCHIRITTSGGKSARLEPGRRALRPAQAWRRAKALAEQLRHEQDLSASSRTGSTSRPASPGS